MILLQRKSEMGKTITLVLAKDTICVPPESETIIPIELSGTVEPGDHCVTPLDNAPVVSDYPGIIIPNALITVTSNNCSQLAIINSTSSSFSLPRGTVIGITERIEEHEIAFVENECSDEDTTSKSINPSSPPDLTQCKLDHVTP